MLSPSPAALSVIPPAHPLRGPAEGFVRAVYRQHYGAEVRRFAPFLVMLQDAPGEIVAVAGWRPAAQGPLYLETYLDAPVDALLGGIARERIVEVGHLAAARAGAGRRLIALMGPHLAACGFHWVVGTLTEELRHLFVRLGIPPLALGRADPSLLPDGTDRWGSYYDHHPVVAAGRIDVALQALARRGQASAQAAEGAP